MANKKSAKKSEMVSFTLKPFGIARFTHLNSPDTEGKYANGEFKTDILLDDEDVAGVRAEIEAAAKQLLPNVALEDVKLPLKEMFNKDRHSGEKTSAGFGIKCHSKRRPALWDSKRQKLPVGVKVGSGSVIRMGGVLKAWDKTEEETIVDAAKKTKTKQQVTVYGLTLYLNSVQVKSLSAGSTSDGSEFDEVEDGFEYTADVAGSDGSEFGEDATDL